jgi:hypothetical protein
MLVNDRVMLELKANHTLALANEVQFGELPHGYRH